MTIDLGFATCQLPNHRRVGIVDVPGHERFIHNMVAGATAIDAVLLVVAADDGVMPQTIEHFHIVRLLGVQSGMVAVTKSDLASPERVAEVVEHVRALVGGSFLDGCPIVPLSTKTGAGFDAFYDAFVSLVDRTTERNAGGCFRMHVERSFVMKGLGPIVSGIPRSGRVRIGDVLELLPAGDQKKVRGLQVYGEDATEGRAGECVALRLGDLDAEEARRGMVLASPGYFEPARFINIRFQLLPGLDRPLRPRTAVRLHMGTSDMPGHLLLPDLVPLKPGGETYVQVQLQNPVVAAPHDVCVVRMLSPARTLGGGTVIGTEPEKMRRTRGTWVEHCTEQERAFHDPASAVAYVVAHATASMDAAAVAKRCLLSPEAAASELRNLAAQGGAVALEGNRFAHADSVREVRLHIETALGALHDRSPLSLGFPRKELMPRLQDDRPLVEHALAELLREGRVRQTGAGYQWAARAPALDPEQEKVATALRQIYRSGGFQSPRPDELAGLTGAPEPRAQAVLAHLCQTGELVRLDDRVVLHRDFVQLSRQKILEHFSGQETLEPGQIKDALGTTRKYVIPILEYWDAQGLTRRVGNARVLRKTENAPPSP